MKRLAIFASGSGSNAEAIVQHFVGSTTVQVGCIVTNNAQAGVVARAQRFGVPCVVIPSVGHYADAQALPQLLHRLGVDAIALAGYLKKIPAALLAAYPDRILNIHPSLLPRHGGQGMYGLRVHQAVLAAGDAESGISIHLVNADYDQGRILHQARLAVQPGWAATDLQAAVHQLEHQHYPTVIAQWCAQLA